MDKLFKYTPKEHHGTSHINYSEIDFRNLIARHYVLIGLVFRLFKDVQKNDGGLPPLIFRARFIRSQSTALHVVGLALRSDKDCRKINGGGQTRTGGLRRGGIYSRSNSNSSKHYSTSINLIIRRLHHNLDE